MASIEEFGRASQRHPLVLLRDVVRRGKGAPQIRFRGRCGASGCTWVTGPHGASGMVASQHAAHIEKLLATGCNGHRTSVR